MGDNPFGKNTAKIISRPLNRRKNAKPSLALHESNDGFEVKVMNTTHFAASRPAGEKRCGFVSVKTFNVIICGVVFAGIFTAFTPTQVRFNSSCKDLQADILLQTLLTLFSHVEPAIYHQ